MCVCAPTQCVQFALRSCHVFWRWKYYSRDVSNSIYSLNSLSNQILCVLPPPSPLPSTTLLTRCCTYYIWEMLLKRYGQNIICYNVLKSIVYSKRSFVAVPCTYNLYKFVLVSCRCVFLYKKQPQLIAVCITTY